MRIQRRTTQQSKSFNQQLCLAVWPSTASRASMDFLRASSTADRSCSYSEPETVPRLLFSVLVACEYVRAA
jgi:hypothetical protein